MEKYRRIVDPSKQASIFPEDKHVQRINVSGKLSNYVAYAERMLADESIGKVELVALGRAINRAVTVAEILRRNTPGLHQLTTLRSVSIKDKYIPIEEGLNELEMERVSSCISIMLAKNASTMDTSAAGYSPPTVVPPADRISAELIAEMDQERAGSHSRRGKGNGANRNGRGGRRSGGNRRGRGQKGQVDGGTGFSQHTGSGQSAAVQR